MKVSEKVLDFINNDISQLYEHFLLVIEELSSKDKNKIYDEVRWGKDTKFDIHDYLQNERIINKINHYVIREPYSNKKISVNVEDFRSEIEYRKRIMREVIYENIGMGESIKPHNEED